MQSEKMEEKIWVEEGDPNCPHWESVYENGIYYCTVCTAKWYYIQQKILVIKEK